MKTLDEINASPTVVGFSMVHLDCETLKQDLASKSNQLIQKLVEQVLEINRKANLAYDDSCFVNNSFDRKLILMI
jgi:hypothetical protein